MEHRYTRTPSSLKKHQIFLGGLAKINPHLSFTFSQVKSGGQFALILAIAGLLGLAWLGVIFGWRGSAQASQQPQPRAKSAYREKFNELYQSSPLSFEANSGQADSQVKYLSRGSGYGLFLTADEAVFTFNRPDTSRAVRSLKEKLQTDFLVAPPVSAQRSSALRMKLVRANRAAQVVGFEPLASKSNYLIGSDPGHWRTGVQHYAKVKYEGVYPGIDLVYYGNQRQLEYDFVLAPGAQPEKIAIAFAGVRGIRVDESGELVLSTEAGEMRQQKPVIYQEIAGTRRLVAGKYVLRPGQQVGFEIAAYDRSQTLVIDPVLIYSTYLGGSDNEYGNGIEVDSAGNAYVTGITYSSDFPTRNQLQFSLRGIGNAFVAKYDPTGKLVYATYLGGAGEDVGFAIAVDSLGSAYVTGAADSPNFPTTNGSYATEKRGRLDAFVAKLSPLGESLVYCTYWSLDKKIGSHGLAL